MNSHVLASTRKSVFSVKRVAEVEQLNHFLKMSTWFLRPPTRPRIRPHGYSSVSVRAQNRGRIIYIVR